MKKANKRILLSSPTMHKEELDFIHEAFDKNWVAPLGFNCDGFENEMVKYLGWGNAFATIGALESYLLKYWNESFNLSENNMKNIMKKYGINGSEWDPNDDGANDSLIPFFKHFVVGAWFVIFSVDFSIGHDTTKIFEAFVIHSKQGDMKTLFVMFLSFIGTFSSCNIGFQA